MYHKIAPDIAPQGMSAQGAPLLQDEFARQIESLRRRYALVSLAEYIRETRNNGRNKNNMISVTFDDGTAITYEMVRPVAEAVAMPITIFVSTCHIDDGPLTWGGYINALCRENFYSNIEWEGDTFHLDSAKARAETRRRLLRRAFSSDVPPEELCTLMRAYPLYGEILKYYRGMTSQQLLEAGAHSLVEIGSHSVNHPFLSSCTREMEVQEVTLSKSLLEEKTGNEVRYFGYPSGNYSQRTITSLRSAGYAAAFAVKSNQLGDPEFEWPRVGIYLPSLCKLRVKMWMHQRGMR